MSNKNNKTTDNLYEAVLALKNRKEARMFLEDLLTPKEVKDLANRWEIAKLLARGISYSKVVKKTKASSATIAKVAKQIKKGKRGYKLMIRRVG
jgi:TrpR-related protein YerC/YecD